MNHTITARHDDGTTEITYGEHSRELTKQYEVKAVFFLTDPTGKRSPRFTTTSQDRKIAVRFFDAVAINILDEVKLLNTSTDDVHEGNLGRVVEIQPPAPLAGS